MCRARRRHRPRHRHGSRAERTAAPRPPRSLDRRRARATQAAGRRTRRRRSRAAPKPARQHRNAKPRQGRRRRRRARRAEEEDGAAAAEEEVAAVAVAVLRYDDTLMARRTLRLTNALTICHEHRNQTTAQGLAPHHVLARPTRTQPPPLTGSARRSASRFSSKSKSTAARSPRGVDASRRDHLARRRREQGPRLAQEPEEAGGCTQALCVIVDDVDAHCERARAAGATMPSSRRPPTTAMATGSTAATRRSISKATTGGSCSGSRDKRMTPEPRRDVRRARRSDAARRGRAAARSRGARVISPTRSTRAVPR